MIKNMVSILGTLEPYYIITVVVIGLTGNSISFFLFAFSRLRFKEMHMMLAVLALADNGFLLVLFFITLKHFNIDLLNSYELACKLGVYLPYLFGFISVWLIVVFSIERFIAVYYPFRRYEVCNQKRNFQSIITIALFAVGFYSYAFWTTSLHSTGVGMHICQTDDNWISLFKIMAMFDTILTMFAPCLFIFALNLLIIVKLAKKKNFSIKNSRTVNPTKTTELSCLSESSFTNAANPEGVEKKFKGSGLHNEDESDSQDDSSLECRNFIACQPIQKTSNARERLTPQPKSRVIIKIRSPNVSTNSSSISGSELRRKNACMPQSSLNNSNSNYRNRVIRLLSANDNSSDTRQKGANKPRYRQYSKTTRMLLVISATFLMLHGPTAVLKLYYIFKYLILTSSSNHLAMSSQNETDALIHHEASILETNLFEELIERITSYIYYLHYSLNFFLYVFNLKKFRFVFFKCLRRKA